MLRKFVLRWLGLDSLFEENEPSYQGVSNYEGIDKFAQVLRDANQANTLEVANAACAELARQNGLRFEPMSFELLKTLELPRKSDLPQVANTSDQ